MALQSGSDSEGLTSSSDNEGQSHAAAANADASGAQQAHSEVCSTTLCIAGSATLGSPAGLCNFVSTSQQLGRVGYRSKA